MTATRSRTRSVHLAIVLGPVALLMATVSTTSAQVIPDLFTRVETLTLSDGTPAVGDVSIGGDTAVVNDSGGGHVFEREPGATLGAHCDAGWRGRDRRHRRPYDWRGGGGSRPRLPARTGHARVAGSRTTDGQPEIPTVLAPASCQWNNGRGWCPLRRERSRWIGTGTGPGLRVRAGSRRSGRMGRGRASDRTSRAGSHAVA